MISDIFPPRVLAEQRTAEVEALASLASALAASILPKPHTDPAAWCAENIIFSSPRDPIQGPLDLQLSPFLIDPIRAWDIQRVHGLREVTFVAPEQIGKSATWYSGLAWAQNHYPGVALIYYTSETKSRIINSTKIRPILENIPDFRSYLNMPGSATASQYRLGPAQIFFGGVGARISAVTSVYNVADEIDDWEPPRGTSPLDDLRKRSRTFARSLLFKVCTPLGTARQSRIWREFLNSSQGYWFLRCQGCGELTIRSCDIHHLQFDLAEQTDPGVHALPIPESLRLVCPKCRHEHLEIERPAMIRGGAYVHKYPDRLDNQLGFQVGLLASQFPSGSWMSIATAQVRAGRSGDEEAQRYFDNSIRGLPFKARKLDTSCSRALHIHQVETPPPSVIRWRFLAADTQEDCFWYVVRGVDSRLNSYLLECGRVDSLDALRQLIQAQHHGGPLFASIIDEGGHRQDEVRQLTSLPCVYTYKGNTSIRLHYKTSDDFPRLILGHAEYWRIQLLQKMYAAARTPDHYWYTTEAMTDDYVKHLSAWTKPTSGKLADQLGDGDVSCYRRTDGAPDHLFDSEKMCLLLIDYAWRRAIRPVLERRFAQTPAPASRAGAEPGTAAVEGLPS